MKLLWLVDNGEGITFTHGKVKDLIIILHLIPNSGLGFIKKTSQVSDNEITHILSKSDGPQANV